MSVERPMRARPVLIAALAAGLLAGPSIWGPAIWGTALAGALDDAITDNTLVYPGSDGKENLIHFGKYGNFDWYFPCRIESGSWTLDPDGTLHLTYDNSDFAPRDYGLALDGRDIAMADPATGGRTAAEIIRGNVLPYT
jgi:hypothetical protein